MSGILCCKFVGASLFIGYSFQDDLCKTNTVIVNSQTSREFPFNLSGLKVNTEKKTSVMICRMIQGFLYNKLIIHPKCQGFPGHPTVRIGGLHQFSIECCVCFAFALLRSLIG